MFLSFRRIFGRVEHRRLGLAQQNDSLQIDSSLRSERRKRCRHTEAFAEVSFFCKGKQRQQRPKNLFCSKQTLIIASHLQVVHSVLLFAKLSFTFSVLLRTGFALLTRRPAQNQKKALVMRAKDCLESVLRV